MSPMPDNPQIAFWRGEFGDGYVERNGADDAQIRKLQAVWTGILARTSAKPLRSILEVGPNIGLNLRALRALTDARFYAVEPNDRAREILLRDRVLDAADLRAGAASAISFPDGVADLAFTSGVLIHVHPDDLLASCREIHRCSKNWLLSIEYFADRPESICYRGYDNVLFKRDFGSFWLDHFSDLSVASYGFVWKRETGLDNTNWWLFRKS
jgi:pseudaminic acid biosynthesis-associated methylase